MLTWRGAGLVAPDSKDTIKIKADFSTAASGLFGTWLGVQSGKAVSPLRLPPQSMTRLGLRRQGIGDGAFHSFPIEISGTGMIRD